MHHTINNLPPPHTNTAQLRVIATTDLHMELRGFDYVTESAMSHTGLAGIATLIAQARAEATDLGRANILLDNGDLLQGNALASWLAKQPVGENHPVVSILNTLAYDAIGVGNHDLDHGAPYLLEVAEYLNMPVVASNLQGPALAPIVPNTLIPVSLDVGGTDTTEHLTIGILSVLPEETAIWNRDTLAGQAEVTPAIAAIKQAIPALRAQGADLILLLAHMGIEKAREHQANPSQDALELAQIEGVDALITGHTHLRFPGSDHFGRHGVDPNRGTLAGRPTIMAGHAGSDLAIMDLTLRRTATGGWTVTDHNSQLVPNTKDIPPDPTVMDLSTAAHLATRATLTKQIGVTKRPLHNYFSMVAPTRTATLIARAKLQAARTALAKGPAADLPLLATAAAHTAGGRGGADHFLNIDAGAVLGRHMAGLNPYTNDISAILQTGAQLRTRLEHSARIFATLLPDQPDQPLLDPDIPSYDFDTIYGITYQIDPTVPPNAPTGRIKSLCYLGRPITNTQQFALVTNQFRVSGGGGYEVGDPSSTLLDTPLSLDHALQNVLSSTHPDDPPLETPWSLIPNVPVQAVLQTTPRAASYLADIAQYTPETLGTNAAGFLRVRLSL